MPKFHTIYNVAESNNKDKVYDTHDNVDRVSYVDSTRLVERFILEGHNLNAVRAKALRSGLYSGDLKEIDEDDGIAIPVYAQDPAVTQPIIDELKKTRAARSAKVNDNDSNDDATFADSQQPGRSPDNSESNA